MPASIDVDPDAAERFRANRQRSLASKFRCAFRGLKRAVRSESNFFVHLLIAGMVVAAGLALRVSALEWCLLALCITAVLWAETANTAIEMLAKAVGTDYDAHIEDALDTASASVLVAACGAAVVGSVIFLHRLGPILRWW